MRSRTVREYLPKVCFYYHLNRLIFTYTTSQSLPRTQPSQQPTVYTGRCQLERAGFTTKAFQFPPTLSSLLRIMVRYLYDIHLDRV